MTEQELQSSRAREKIARDVIPTDTSLQRDCFDEIKFLPITLIDRANLGLFSIVLMIFQTYVITSNLPISRCCSQVYDGESDMTSNKSREAAEIIMLELNLAGHCYFSCTMLPSLPKFGHQKYNRAASTLKRYLRFGMQDL